VELSPITWAKMVVLIVMQQGRDVFGKSGADKASSSPKEQCSNGVLGSSHKVLVTQGKSFPARHPSLSTHLTVAT
jgi:hypothetical protein